MLLSLNCFILEKPNRIFTVKIPNNESVSILKDLIKEKQSPRLNHVIASDLDLWKCSIAADDKLQETLNNICFDIRDDHLDHLSPLSLVSKYIAAGLLPETIHILVQLLPLVPVLPIQRLKDVVLTIYCMLQGLTALSMTKSTIHDKDSLTRSRSWNY